MRSNVYTCNDCGKALSFSDYPPVGDVSAGFTCPECSKHAKEIVGELESRLHQCGKHGRITKDYYSNKLTPAQLSFKYGCTEKEALDSIALCMHREATHLHYIKVAMMGLFYFLGFLCSRLTHPDSSFLRLYLATRCSTSPVFTWSLWCP